MCPAASGWPIAGGRGQELAGSPYCTFGMVLPCSNHSGALDTSSEPRAPVSYGVERKVTRTYLRSCTRWFDGIALIQRCWEANRPCGVDKE